MGVKIMLLNEHQKMQVQLSELQERYSAARKMRERSIQFILWISGMPISLGWLLIGQKALVLSQRIALTLLVLALFTGTSYFILRLQRGFRKNREAMIRCERHKPGVYLTDCALLPSEYDKMKGFNTDLRTLM